MPALWATDTMVATASGAKTILYPREVMYPGDSFLSPNGTFRFQFQEDGNAVLVQLPDTVLWASDTAGGDTLVMQADGNLVIYGGGTALWESDTEGNEGAYLVLQNDGNLVIYSAKSVEAIAVWPIPPDWAGGVSEVLAWQTGVAMSPAAVEQRIGLRLSPRQSFELSFVVHGPVRTLFDLLTIRGGGSPIYLPIWQDQERLQADAAIGATTLSLDTAYTQFTMNSPWLILWESPFIYELVEIAVIGPEAIQLASGLVRSWGKGTRVYPIKKCRYESQPTTSRRADGAFVARVRFMILGDVNRGWYDPLSAPSGYEATCLHEFQWNAGTPTDNGEAFELGQQSDRLNKYGHMYRTIDAQLIQIWSDSGTLVNTLDEVQLADLIDAWYGEPIVPRSDPPDPYDFRGIKLQPIFNGEFVIAFLMALGGSPLTSWWALLDPQEDGTFICLGAVYISVLFGPPYYYFQSFRLFDVWRMNDPIYVEGDYNLFDNASIIWTLPSINEFLSDAYKEGYDALPPCRIPIVVRHPFGNNIDLVQFWLVQNQEYLSRNFGCMLPSSSGGLIFYTYIHSSYMDSATTYGEIRDVIQPAYPDGCMIKIDMGEYTFAELAETMSYSDPFRGITTGLYSIDNANWTEFDGVTPAIPFRDERTYISNDLPGGWDHYEFQTTVIERPGLRYWVFFYMLGEADAKFRAGNTSPSFGTYASPIYLRFKLFEYDPLTETARRLTTQTCLLRTDAEIPHSDSQLLYDHYQIAVVEQSGSQVTLSFRSHVYKTVFATFEVPG